LRNCSETGQKIVPKPGVFLNWLVAHISQYIKNQYFILLAFLLYRLKQKCLNPATAKLKNLSSTRQPECGIRHLP